MTICDGDGVAILTMLMRVMAFAAKFHSAVDDADDTLIGWSLSETAVPHGVEWWSRGQQRFVQRTKALYFFDESYVWKPEAAPYLDNTKTVRTSCKP